MRKRNLTSYFLFKFPLNFFRSYAPPPYTHTHMVQNQLSGSANDRHRHTTDIGTTGKRAVCLPYHRPAQLIDDEYLISQWRLRVPQTRALPHATTLTASSQFGCWIWRLKMLNVEWCGDWLVMVKFAACWVLVTCDESYCRCRYKL